MKYTNKIGHAFPPYKHQADAIETGVPEFLQNGYFAFFCEMGTGKTKISINVFEILRQLSNITVIIIPPKILFDTWAEELEKHLNIPYNLFFWNAARSKTQKYQKEYSNFISTTGLKIVLFNVEAFQRKNDHIESIFKSLVKDSFIIIDESTKIKTHNSMRTKNILKMTKNGKYKTILTGTEITKTILDLYSQFEFLKSGFWGMPYSTFYYRYSILEPVQMGNGQLLQKRGRTIKKVAGFRRVNEIMDKIKPHFYRALKKDCLDLPEKIFTKIKIEMNTEQARYYKELKERLYAEYKGVLLTVGHKATLFTRFRQVTGGFTPDKQLLGDSNVKLNTILDDSEGQEKIIIVSAFVSEIEHIGKVLGNKCALVYGAVSKEERDHGIDRFKNDPSCKYIVLNPKTGSFGLNLQVSSLMYLFSRTLSPEENAQIVDRMHRIGQKETCVYKDVICKNTIDERVLGLIKQSADLLDAIRSDDIKDFIQLF